MPPRGTFVAIPPDALDFGSPLGSAAPPPVNSPPFDQEKPLPPAAGNTKSGCTGAPADTAFFGVPGGPDRPPLDCSLNEAAAHPGDLPAARFQTSDESCAFARRETDRLRAVAAKLENQMKLVDARKQKESGYYRPWEDLREEAVSGIADDILDAVDVFKVFERLQAVPKYEKAAPQLHAAYDALIAAAKMAQGVDAGPGPERDRNILESTVTVRKAILDIPVDRLNKDDPAKKYLEHLGNFYDALVKMLAFYDQHRDRQVSAAELADSYAKLTANVIGLWSPPVKIGTLLEGALERPVKGLIAQQAMNNLNGIVARDSMAEFYLRERLDRIKSFQKEEERTVTMCTQR
jgi:hypothetical protein